MAWSTTPLRAEQIRTSHLFLKALQRLVISDSGTLSQNITGPRGDDDPPQAVNLAQAFFRTTPQLLQSITNARRAVVQAMKGSASAARKENQAILAALTKHLLAFGKIFLALVGRDRSKAASWQGWLDIVWWYWQEAREFAVKSPEPSMPNTDPTDLVRTPSRFVIQALLLLKESLSKWKQEPERAAGLLSIDFAKEASEILVGKMMRLNKEELAEWDADPEQWSVAESQKQEQFDLEIRTAAERTLMVLAATVKPKYSVGRHVWKLFEMLAQLGTSTLDDVLTRDAIYAAVGRLRDHLPVVMPGHVPDPDEEEEESFDLSTVIGERLVREASSGPEAGASWVIIRRRIAWLIWEWSERVSTQHRPATYEVLVNLLADTPSVTDIAVRLAAARSLGALADAVEFDAETFTPYLEPALTRLASLAASSSLQEMDSIKTCTDALSLLIERLGPRIVPHIHQLASLAAPLWNVPDSDFRAKPSVLVYVTNLVRAIEMLSGGGSEGLLEPLHGIVRDLVRSSMQKVRTHGAI